MGGSDIPPLIKGSLHKNLLDNSGIYGKIRTKEVRNSYQFGEGNSLIIPEYVNKF